jgi:biopolymer transport protein ExbB/TolQ
MPNNPDWAAEVRAKLNWWYTFFLTMISVFPLLGMFGTVAALLNLDFSDIAGSLDNVKTDFFHALTSTAWGIVFSVLFKLLNAWLFYDIEDIYEEIDNVVRENKLAAQERLYAAKSAVQDSRNDIYSGIDDLSLPEEYNFENQKDNYYEN